MNIERKTMLKWGVVLGVICVGLCVLYVAGKSIILAGIPITKLPESPSLHGQISQFLASSSETAPEALPQDFTITNTKYFATNAWAVAQIRDKKGNTDAGLVILEKKNGIFVPVLGPGTIFSKNDLYVLPEPVATYLTEKGVVYGI